MSRRPNPPARAARAGLGRRLAGALSGSSQIAVAMMVMNVATYGFSMAAARLVGPVAYGAFFALMNLMLIVNVVSLGLQTTAARRISAEPGHTAQIAAGIVRVSYRVTFVLSALLLLGAPVIDVALDLDSLPLALLAGVAAVPLTMMGAQAGILQGERRWRELAVLYVLAGVPRLVIGLALLLWRPTEQMAFLGAVVGFAAPYLYGTWVLRHGREAEHAQGPHGLRSVGKEALVNSQALFAYFALTNVDMLVGRSVLDSHDSGLYAAGLIVARAVLFLPQFIVVVAFPSMATAGSRVRAVTLSLGLVAGIGAACTLTTLLLPDLVLMFAGGDAYVEIRARLWLFALLGTVMAMLQLLVYSVLARRGRVSTYVVWVGLVALVAAGFTVSTVDGLLAVVLLVQGSLLLVLLAVSVVKLRQEAPAPAQ